MPGTAEAQRTKKAAYRQELAEGRTPLVAVVLVVEPGQGIPVWAQPLHASSQGSRRTWGKDSVDLVSQMEPT